MECAERGQATGAAAVAVSTVSDGVLNIKKERGYTSHDVVARLRRLLHGPKVGHAGTLDPDATGVLPVLIGKATRVAEYLTQWDKEYRAVLRLGASTDTQDATGTVLATYPVGGVTEEMVRRVLPAFVGPLLQVPPMYSAVKVGGVPLYKAARAGRTIEREARTITVHRIDLLGIEGRDVALEIECSKGTYIRTLCAEIGGMLGLGGHMAALERSRVGPMTLHDARTLDEVAALVSLGRLHKAMLSIDEVLADMPSLSIRAADVVGVLHGAPIPQSAIAGIEPGEILGLPEGQIVRLKDPTGRLLGLGAIPGGGLKGVDNVSASRPVRVVKVFEASEGRC